MTRDTVFAPSFGNRPSFLVGREQTIAQLMNGLAQEPGSKDRSVVLLGQRGSGKTVLLWELGDRASEAGYVVASPTIVSENMLDRIVEKVQDSGERFVTPSSTVHVSGGSVGALGFSVGLQFTREVQETKSAQYKLTQLARRLTEQGHGILVLIDELQANSLEVRQLVTVYQEMVGERLNVALVMAGLPGAVSATLNDRVLTFLNRARKVVLPPLPLSDIDAFYAHGFAELGIGISTESRLKAAEFAEGSPYMMQLVGHNIALRTDDAGMLSPSVFAEALDMAKREFENDVCETTLAALSDRDVDFLAAMSDDKGPSRVSDIARRMDVAQDYAQKYRRRLIDAGVIEAPRRGYVDFAVPYLGEYLRVER